MEISISKFSPWEGSLNIMMNEEEKVVTYNGSVTDFECDRFAFLVCSAVSGWPNELVNHDILDGTTYRITINSERGKREFVYKNQFPEDFYRIIYVIKEVEKSVKKEQPEPTDKDIQDIIDGLFSF